MKVILLNLLVIAVGSFLGDRLKRLIKQKVLDGVMTALGAVVVVMGATGISRDVNTLTLLIAYAAGSFIGFSLDLDGKLERLSDAIEKRLGGMSGLIGPGMSFFIVSCSGAYTVNACFMAGAGDFSFLYTKMGLDIVFTLAMSSAMGIGVITSVVPTFIFESGLYLLSGVLAPLMTQNMITSFASAGSLVAAMIGLNLIGAVKIKTVNLLPAVLIAPFAQMLVEILPL